MGDIGPSKAQPTTNMGEVTLKGENKKKGGFLAKGLLVKIVGNPCDKITYNKISSCGSCNH
jgi:hypothetical protein